MKENNDVIVNEEVVKVAKLRKTKMNKNVKLFLNIAGIGLVGGAIGGLAIYTAYKLGLKGDRIIADVVKETEKEFIKYYEDDGQIWQIIHGSSEWSLTKEVSVPVEKIIEELLNGEYIND